MRKLVVFSILAVLAVSQVQAQTRVNTGALWRSCLLSGWGQKNAGYSSKGAAYMVTGKMQELEVSKY